jgi:Ca-activated chloride channel homolog
MTGRRALLALTVALAATGVVVVRGAATQQDSPTGASVRIVTPEEGDYLSGVVMLRAEVSPPEVVGQVEELVFWVDGRVVCRLQAPPFECEWDAGRRVEARQVRVVVRTAQGQLVHTVRTGELDLSETVDVDAVQVVTVVKDAAGEFVRGLPRDAFRVYEDDVPQPLSHFASEKIPLELVAAIDISGSMKRAMPQVKSAAGQFLQGLEEGHEVTVLAFNDNLFTLARRGTDPSARARVLDRLAAWGSTALYDAIVSGLEQLSRRPGRRAMVLFTDGDDKLSHATLEAVVRRVESSDATLYMIGQGQAATNARLQELLTRLAAISGGKAFFEADADRLGGVFDDILEDLSNQYLLTYQPGEMIKDGRWRSIRVEVDGPGYEVRARQGYRPVRVR